MMKIYLKLLLGIFLHFSAYAGGDSEEGRMHHAQRLSVDPSRTKLHDTTSGLPRSVSFDPSARHRDNKGNIASGTDSFHDAQPPATPKNGPAFPLREPARAHSTASRITHLSHRFMDLFGHPLGGRVNTPTPTPTTAEPPQRQPSTQHQAPTVTVLEEEPYTDILLLTASQVAIRPDLWPQVLSNRSDDSLLTAIVTAQELGSPINLPEDVRIRISRLIIRSMDRQPSPGPISIEAFPHLTQFSARGVPIDSADLIQIFEALPNTIRHLDLTGVGLGNDIKSVPALRRYLESLPPTNIIALGLATNGLTAAHAGIIAPHIRTCLGLQDLNLSYNHFPPETSELFINSLPSGLRKFYYDRNPLSDIALKILDKRLSAHPLDDNALPGLQILGLSETSPAQKRLRPASYSPTLHQLDLSFCNMGPEGVQKLSARMLEKTSPFDLTRLKFSKLRILDLTGNEMGHTGAIELSKAILHIKELQALFLGGNDLGDKGAALVIRSLLGYRDLTQELPEQATLTLQTLVLNQNQITNYIIPLIEALLENVPTLKKLYLEGNPIETKKISSFKRATDPSL